MSVKKGAATPPPLYVSEVPTLGVGCDGRYVILWSSHIGRFEYTYDQAVALATHILREATALKAHKS